MRKIIVMSAPGPSKRVRTTTQKNISDWNWTPKDNNPIIFPFNTYSGVCTDLLKKYESQPPSELEIFLEYMDPLFVKICEETNAYATCPRFESQGFSYTGVKTDVWRHPYFTKQ
jgi:hypothetical protein